MTPAGGFPVGGQTNIDIRNEHMQYIITWYAHTKALAYHSVRPRFVQAREPTDWCCDMILREDCRQQFLTLSASTSFFSPQQVLALRANVSVLL